MRGKNKASLIVLLPGLGSCLSVEKTELNFSNYCKVKDPQKSKRALNSLELGVPKDP